MSIESYKPQPKPIEPPFRPEQKDTAKPIIIRKGTIPKK